MRRAEHGFTLFEVLGAVALLALVYGTLSTVAIRGLRTEGESQRVLKASLLADWELNGLEMQIEPGLGPIHFATHDDRLIRRIEDEAA